MFQNLELNDYVDFFTTLYVIIAGTSLSVWLVALSHYFGEYNSVPEQSFNPKASDLYEYEYLEEYELLEERELTNDYISNLKQYTITEKTPKGTVLMFYNHETESFWYYFDGIPGITSCPYKYLETVARAYILKYDCKQLLIDYRQELINGKDRMDKQKNADLSKEEDKQETKNSLYASFKHYNRGHSTAKNIKNYYLITEKANRYSYKGKISSYNPVETTKNAHKNIDFKEFKATMGRVEKIKTF